MCVVCQQLGMNLHESGDADQPLAFLNADERGGSALQANGKESLTTAEAAVQITRDGYTWNGIGVIGQAATVTYAFRSSAPSPMPEQTSGFTSFTAVQIAQAERALQSWSDVANITFQRVGGAGYSNSAQILFGDYSSGAEGAAAFAFYPTQGDIWVNSTIAVNRAPAHLNYGRQTLTHEIGHAIGLAHPGEYDASEGEFTYEEAAEYFEDSRQYSVMSYFGSFNTGASLTGFASAPQLDDIAAAQRLYGANMTTRTGDTVYGWNSNTGRDFLSAADAQPTLIFAAWDAGGTDVFDFSGFDDGGVIDLRQGFFSSVGGLVGNVAVAMGTVIENAFGGSGAEIMNGNAASNFLKGGGGADRLFGLEGADKLQSLIARDPIWLDGGQGRDWLRGGFGADSLYGGEGSDRLEGGEGDDRFFGGVGGRDLFSFNGGGLDAVDGFQRRKDHLALPGEAQFTAARVADHNGDGVRDTVLTHAEGTVVILGVAEADLADWNGFLV